MSSDTKTIVEKQPISKKKARKQRTKFIMDAINKADWLSNAQKNNLKNTRNFPELLRKVKKYEIEILRNDTNA